MTHCQDDQYKNLGVQSLQGSVDPTVSYTVTQRTDTHEHTTTLVLSPQLLAPCHLWDIPDTFTSLPRG